MRGPLWGVADDLVGVAVLDRAQVELALTGGVLGDVSEPDLVRCRGGMREVVGDAALVVDAREQVVMDRRSRLTGLAWPAVVGGEDTRARAQSPDAVL